MKIKKQLILDKICNYKEQFIIKQKIKKNFIEIRKEAENIKTKSKFEESLINTKNIISIIAEIKQQSPSQGLLDHKFNVKKIARSYNNAGATALSILTDEKYFLGHNDNIQLAKTESNLPILRKDFIIDEYQIYESKILKADCILLIMSCLPFSKIQEFEKIAHSLGLDVLIESHNKEELEKAITLKTSLIGINNRNLNTLDITFNNSKHLYNLVPKNKLAICESGINSKKDIDIMKKYGFKSFLIGSYLMKSTNKEQSLKEMFL